MSKTHRVYPARRCQDYAVYSGWTFNANGGRASPWFINAGSSAVDNFGGGNAP